MSYRPLWEGVVMIERPDPRKTSHTPFEDPTCLVRSAISTALNGRRAIACRMPLSRVRHYFRSTDGDHVFVRAVLHGDHLELHDRETFDEWADTSHTAVAAG